MMTCGGRDEAMAEDRKRFNVSDGGYGNKYEDERGPKNGDGCGHKDADKRVGMDGSGGVARLLEENRKLREELEDAQSASKAKDVFLSNMSHDIRTPMNAIMGMTTIALSHIDEKNRVLDCLGKIQTASSHLMSLINDVLDMSHIESGKMTIHKEPFSLPDVFHDVVVIVRPQAEQKKQALKFEIEDIRDEELVGDALRIRQVLVNIIGNAVKYTQEGGSIRVVLRQVLGGEQKAPVFEFVCQDNGMGMSEEFLTRVFLPFERAGNTTQSKIEGTGLGLAICHRLVVQMGGEFRVESRLGEGSCFTVAIPLEVQDIHENQKFFSGETVLVVENDAGQVEKICGYLRDGGLRPQVVGKSVDAVTFLTETLYEGNAPHAVLLGEDLDGAYALDVAACLRQIAGKGLPILLVSEADWPQMEYRAVRAGINGFVPCPLFRSRLISAIRGLAADGGKGSADCPGGADYGGKRFLLAEDNLLNQEIAIELLSDMGIAIEAADNGEEAVRMFAESKPGYYDLILMDIQMPVMDGYEATRRIRALDREDAADICIVAMTANVFAKDVRRSRKAGMDFHLAKPIDVKKIEEVLQKLA